MIEHGHSRQRADKKETDLANTKKEMTQYNPMTKSHVGLKTATVQYADCIITRPNTATAKSLGVPTTIAPALNSW
jgi:hypothetical protein